jgi:hypothetical protein
MQLLSRLQRLEVRIKPRRELSQAMAERFSRALADYDAKRKSGIEIDEDEKQRFARVFELLDIARARRDKALGIRRRSRKE